MSRNKIISLLSRWHVRASVVIVNTIILLFLVNIGIFLVQKLVARDDRLEDTTAEINPWLEYYGYETVSKFIPGKDEKELNDFLNDTWVTPQEYAPFIQLKSMETKSKYHNVHQAGFRSIGAEQEPWPPDPRAFNIFVFGGSTTLGVGVADNETIPAWLQELLREAHNDLHINVYNFGTGSHFSTLERVYLDQLLMKGYVPNLAVFIDGLNDSYFWHGEPVHTGWYRNVLELIKDFNWRHDVVYHLTEVAKKTPLGQLVESWSPTPQVAPFWSSVISEEEASDINKIKLIIDRYERNKRLAEAIATTYGVEVLFVWQPVPFYAYDRLQELLDAFGDAVGEHRRSVYGYPEMRKFVEQNSMGRNFVWCADIGQGVDKTLYIDHVHYNPEMSRMVAECIVHGMAGSLSVKAQ